MKKSWWILVPIAAFFVLAASPLGKFGQDDLMQLQRVAELEREVNLLRIQLVSCQEDKENLQKQLDSCMKKADGKASKTDQPSDSGESKNKEATP